MNNSADTNIRFVGGVEHRISTDGWDTESNPYRCHVAITEEDGKYSVVVMNLPGAGSCGDTEEEALHNAREAVVGVIQSYHDDGEEIPWLSPGDYSVPAGARQKWILVNV